MTTSDKTAFPLTSLQDGPRFDARRILAMSRRPGLVRLLCLALFIIMSCPGHLTGADAGDADPHDGGEGAILKVADPPAGFTSFTPAISVAQLAARTMKAEVPQGADILAIQPVGLPASAPVSLPDPRPGRIGFWLCAQGSAGNPGDLVGRIVVRYANGSTETILLREGERLAGQLKDPFPTQAEAAGAGMVDGRTVTTYVTWWTNPRADQDIAGLTVEAVHPRYILQLLGMRCIAIATPTAELKAPSAALLIGPAIPGKIDPALFGVACPHFLKANRSPDGDNAGYDRDLADLGPRLVSIFAPAAPIDGRGFAPEDLPAEVQQATGRIKTLGLQRIMLRQIQFPREMTDPEAIARIADWYVDCVAWLRDIQGWPIAEVEILNERILSHPIDERQRCYRFYNYVADRLHARVPGLQVGGTAECYPDEGLIREFLRNCGPATDFVTWHLYATGSADTPLADVMRRSDRIARNAERLDAAIQMEVGRPLAQYVTEYHINYSAWKPVDRRVLRGAAAAWSAAVLAQALAKGTPRGALIWHFRDAAYGLYGAKAGMRPAGALFKLLNRLAPGAERRQVAGGRPGLITAAFDGPRGFTALLVNTDPEPAEQVIEGLPARPGEFLSVGPEDEAFTTTSKDAALSRTTLSIPGFGLTVVTVPKAGDTDQRP